MSDTKWFDLQLFADEGGEGENPSAGGEGGADSGTGGANAGNAPAAAGAENAGENNAAANGDAGSKGNTILGGKNGTEDKSSAAGVPEAYDFKSIVPEGMEYNEESAQAFSAVAKECGLSQEQASKLASYGMDYMRQGVAAAQQAVQQQIAGWGEATKKELGGQYQETVSKAGTGIEAISKIVPGIRDALNETGAGNRIEVVRAFALLGGIVGEDSFHGFGAAEAPQSNIYNNTDFSKY